MARTGPILLALIFLSSLEVKAQLTPPFSKWLDSAKALVNEIDQLHKAGGQFSLPSVEWPGIPGSFIQVPDSAATGVNLSLQPLKPTVRFYGGHLNYNYQYRSAIDTPFRESGLSQHLVSGRLNLTVSETLPLTITYFERQSNSKFFRDYRDIRVSFNAAEFRKLKARKLQRYLDELSARLRDPSAKPALGSLNGRLRELNSWMNGNEVVNKLIASRVALLNGGRIDSLTHKKDTSLSEARKFIAWYEQLAAKKKQLEACRDSLQKDYVNSERLIASVKKLSGDYLDKPDRQKALDALSASLGPEAGKLREMMRRASAVQALAIGKVLPNYSDLTLKNINITGINFEYYNTIYFALSAGAIDYRARDFFNSGPKRKPQFVYLLRFGYGSRRASHVHLTGFKGKKQLLNSGHSRRSLDIYGLSLEAQLVVHRNHRITAEVAQSAAPDLVGQGGQYEKASFKLRDEKNKAWTVRLNSSFPKTRSRLEAFYRYRGINFQSFSSYYSNAAIHSWQVKADQYFWKKQLRLNVSVARNNYENSELPVRYSGQTSYTSASLFFRRKKWPSLQLGYMPASQLSEVGGLIYENFYHSLSATATHNYKLGLARGYSIFSFNQFYNNSRDTGFIYYNAKNYYFSQLFQFASYGATLNITRSQSRDYTLTVMETGINLKLKQQNTVGMGVKINQLNGASLRVGLYGSARVIMPKLGELSAWVEKSYLPGWGNQLVENEMYNIGFTRFFK